MISLKLAAFPRLSLAKHAVSRAPAWGVSSAGESFLRLSSANSVANISGALDAIKSVLG